MKTGVPNGSDARHDLPFDSILHVILIPNYKEDFGTQYRVCLAMEESEPGCKEKALKLIEDFGEKFFDLRFTIHPVNRPGEMRGKSSNVAWASQQMARLSTRHHHEIMTVIDADSAFAEDYFMACSYYYAVASPEQRRIMMFAPSTVFDRNANDVPLFVRTTDMFWSIGVISNLYPSSPVKLPCSAYSVSMDLVLSVNFWDAGPEAIGEDMHMYLKCFFSTRGRVIVKSIFSPASSVNITGEGEGMAGYVSSIKARYDQAKRHLWGSLDTGYALRRTLLSYLAPQSEPTVFLKNMSVSKFGKEDQVVFKLETILTLAHRLFEAHIMMGQFFILALTSTLFVPSHALIPSLANWVWSFVSLEPVHHAVSFALQLGFWLRLACIVPNLVTFYYYEHYHEWVGFKRWELQEEQQRETGLLFSKRFDSANDLSGDHFDTTGRVQHLGQRPQLSSRRVHPRNLFDWLSIPVSGFLFYVIPQHHAQLSHLFTERLDYKVAHKPTLVYHKDESDRHSISSKVDQGYFEEEIDRFALKTSMAC